MAIGNHGAAVLISKRPRPLSPHLSIYRWQLGNSLSVLHRATGVVLALGLAALSYWLSALAGGRESYDAAASLFAGPLGLLLIGWTFALAYHLLNGVRHLFWDLGLGFERRPRHVSGWFAVLGAFALTLCVWGLVWHGAHP